MINFREHKKIIITVLILIAIGLIFFAFKKSTKLSNIITFKKPFAGQVINDNPKIPDTNSISSNEGGIVSRGEYNIKIQPQNESEQVVVTQALLTLKQAYNLSLPEIAKWSEDANLVFIKSLGALNLEGRSSAWQIVYGSNIKKSGYEIIIFADKIISFKQIISSDFGYVLPENWFDSNEAIASLFNLPQFKSDTLSALSFYYNSDAQSWAYGLATGLSKTTSMWVK